MQFEREFSQVSKLIQEKKSILLAAHERPDGDSLGSMAAFFSLLKNFEGKEIVMFSRDAVPAHLEFLPHSNDMARSLPSQFKPDLLLAFDYGDFTRLGIEDSWIYGATIVTFDHHPKFKQKGDVRIIDEACSSTCELVYQFFRDKKYSISPQIATALLAGIFTDTGGFEHVNTSKSTLRAVGELLRYGTSIKNLHKHTFSNKSQECLKVWGNILKNINQEQELGMSYVAVSFDEFERFGSSLENFDGIVNVINMPPDVRFSLMLIEYKPGIVKGSLRSEPFKNVDVSKIARAMGGGGHKYAAGFERDGESLKNVVECVKIAAKGSAGLYFPKKATCI